MFVHVRYHGRNPGVQAGVRYISHREEGLPQGRTRTLYGIGERYRALRGDERAIARQLWEDGAGLPDPRYFRLKLTVDDATAERCSRLAPEWRERAIRDAVTRTFRGSLRLVQGTFVFHEHGGRNRPFGHPHAHVHLSPLMVNGRPLRRIHPFQLKALKERWEREVTREVERALERQGRGVRLRPFTLQREPRKRQRDSSVIEAIRRAVLTLQRWRSRGPIRELLPAADEAIRLPRVARFAAGDPARLLAREGLKQIFRSLPSGARTGVEAVRLVSRLIPR